MKIGKLSMVLEQMHNVLQKNEEKNKIFMLQLFDCLGSDG